MIRKIDSNIFSLTILKVTTFSRIRQLTGKFKSLITLKILVKRHIFTKKILVKRHIFAKKILVKHIFYVTLHP